jgi:hypothetical protein
MARKARILVACVQRAYTRLFAIFSGLELVFVTTSSEARAALKTGPFDLVMIGVYFDESRMFDFLEHLRSDAQYDSVPVVCFRGIEAADPVKMGLDGIATACAARGANAYFDLLAFPDHAAGNASIRRLIDEFLGGVRQAT